MGGRFFGWADGDLELGGWVENDGRMGLEGSGGWALEDYGAAAPP